MSNGLLNDGVTIIFHLGTISLLIWAAHVSKSPRTWCFAAYAGAVHFFEHLNTFPSLQFVTSFMLHGRWHGIAEGILLFMVWIELFLIVYANRSLKLSRRAFAEKGLAIARTASPEATARSLAEAALEVVDGDVARMFILEPNGEFRLKSEIFRPDVPPREENEASFSSFWPGTGVAGGVAQTGRTICVDDVTQDPRWVMYPWEERLEIRSYIAAPVRIGDDVAGVFSAMRRSVRPFVREEVKSLEILASFAAAALDKTVRASTLQELSEKSMKEVERKELVSHIIKTVASNQTPVEIFEAVVTEIRKAVPCHRCGISTMDKRNYRRDMWYLHSDVQVEHPADGTKDLVAKRIIASVYEDLSPLYIEDLLDEYDPEGRYAKAGLRSMLCVPIEAGGQCMAHLFACSMSSGAFTQEHQSLLLEVTSHLDPLIRNALLYKEMADRARRLKILNEIAEITGSTLEPAELFQRIGQKILGEAVCDRLLIASVDVVKRREDILFLGGSHPIKPRTANWPDSEVWFEEKVYGMGQFVNHPNLELLQGPRPRLLIEAGFRSCLVVPIVREGETIGHFSLARMQGTPFSEREEAFLADVAKHLAPAMRNAALFKEAEDKARRLEIARCIAQAANSTLSPDKIMRIVIREIRQVIPCQRCNIASFDVIGMRHRILHSESDLPVAAQGLTLEGCDEFLSEVIYREKKVVNIANLAERNEAWARIRCAEGFRSNILLPILHEDVCIAHMALLSTSPAAFTADHENLLLEIRDSLGAAIRNALLHQTAEQRSNRLAALNVLTHKISQNLVLPEVLRSITDSAVELMEIEQARLYLRHDDELRLASYAGNSVVPPEMKVLRHGEGVTGWIGKTGKPTIVGELKDDPRWLAPAWSEEYGIHSLAGYPLKQGDEMAGVLVCLSRNVNYFSPEDMAFLGGLAAHAVTAIQNAKILESEKEARGFLDSIVSGAGNAIITADKNLRIVLWNESAESLLGWAEAEVLGREIKILFPGGEDPKADAALQMTLKGETASFESERLAKDGSRLPLAITLSAVHGLDGNLLGFVSIYHDLSERKRIEQERRRHEARLAKLNELLCGISSSLDLDQVIHLVVESAIELAGVPYASVYVREGDELICRATNEPNRKNIRELKSIRVGTGGTGITAALGKPYYVRNILAFPEWLRKDVAEEEGYSSYLGIPLLEQGQVMGVLGCLTTAEREFASDEVTLLSALASGAAVAIKNARLHKEEAESRRFLHRVVGDTTDSIIIMDPERKIILWNRGAEAIYGYSSAEAVGRSIDLIIPDNQKPKYRTLFGEVIGGDSSVSIEASRLRKDGTEIQISMTLSPIRDDEGKTIAVAAIQKDITELKRAEAALRRSQESLAFAQRIARLGNWDWDICTNELLWSDEIFDIFGLNRFEVKPTYECFLGIVHPDDRYAVNQSMNRALFEGQRYSIDHRIVSGSGEVRFVHAQAEVVLGGDDQAIRMVGTLQDITERILTEIALREGEARLAEAQRIAHVGHWEWHMGRRVGLWSDETYRIFGLEPGEREITRDYLLTRIHIDDRRMADETFKQALSEKMPYDLNYRILMGDGMVRWAHSRAQVYSIGQTGLTKIVGTIQDITEQKISEKALRESEEQIRSLIESTNAIPWEYDTETGRFTYVGPQAGNLLGYPLEEWYREGFWAAHLPADAKSLHSSLDEEALEKGNYVREYRFLASDGRPVWLQEHGSVIGREDGFKTLRGILIDISDRMKAQEEQAQLVTAIEQTSESIVITDAHGKIQYVNPAFERSSGYSRMEAIGGNPRLLNSGKHDRAFYENLWRTIKDGRVWEGNFINKRKDGSLYDEHATISPVVDSAGRITNFVAVKRDISIQLKMEVQLRQAQKLEAIGILASGIAHDFNNILSPIMGYSRMLQSKAARGSSEEIYLDRILKASERAADLVRQILSFSRRQSAAQGTFAIQPVVQESLDLLQASLPATIEIRRSLRAPDAAIMGEPTEIQQVVMNLCTNAAHAIGGASGVLDISLARGEVNETLSKSLPGFSPGSFYVLLTVKDTGCGIPQENIERLFDPFFTTKEAGEGTGLGLSVVHGIVAAHRGGILVSSEVGVGTCFNIYFPAAADVRPSGKGAQAHMSGGRERILLVDDEPEVVMMSEEMLRELGYEVEGFTSSIEALDSFRKGPGKYDLVILDKIMPKMTGERLAREITSARSDIPVVLCSGISSEMSPDEASRSGIQAFVQKPFVPEQIDKVIREVLSPHSQRR